MALDTAQSATDFTTLADFVPQLVWMCTPDGLNIYFNQRWVDYTGLTLEESYGRGWNTPFHSDDKQLAWDAWNKAVRTGEQYCVECRLRAADGSYRRFLIRGEAMRNTSGGILRWLGTCTDIEDLRQESEGQFRAWVTAANSGAVYRMSSDWREMRYLIGNGFIPDTEATNDTWVEKYIPADDRPLVWKTIHEAIRTKGMFELEHRVHKVDGSLGWTFSRAIPLFDANGEIVEWFGVASDVTARKLAEQALLRSEKLASVGRMAAAIAHEINNPLGAVTNLLFLVKEMNDLPEPARLYLEMADAELKRVAHITRQSLGFYREGNAAALTSVNAMLESAVDLLKKKIETKQAIVEKQWDEDVEITAVAGELRQVFANFLANSLDAIDVGGTIKLRVSTATRNGHRRVRVTIADNGKGISVSSQQHLFEPFFTTKGTIGTGLGLWVSKQIIDNHNGAIRVRSTAEGSHRGTVFSLSLPAEPGASGQSARALAIPVRKSS